MVGARAALLALAGLLLVPLLALFGLVTIDEGLRGAWREIAAPSIVLASCLGLLLEVVAMSVVRRIHLRHWRSLARYQLVLSQADEATFEEVAAAYEQLVQALRRSVGERFRAGQPWLALESWFAPPSRTGETGSAALMLLCPPEARESALTALRRAYPDLSLRPDPAREGTPLEFAHPEFLPGHVLRVRKARSWALPIGAGGGESSNARSTMAGIIGQQQQAGRLSCVRWCLLPASDHLDSSASDKLERLVGWRQNTVRAAHVQRALQSAGGAMSFLELQTAVERREIIGRRGRTRRETFSELQDACRQLLSPALSQRGANHLTERLMVFRQRLYQRRWARAEPPLLPDPTGATLVSPRELALLMELPSLGSEHALPLQRNTVPQLPIPSEVPRAALVDLPLPDDPGWREGQGPSDDEIVDAEPVLDEEPAR